MEVVGLVRRTCDDTSWILNLNAHEELRASGSEGWYKLEGDEDPDAGSLTRIKNEDQTNPTLALELERTIAQAISEWPETVRIARQLP